MKNWKKNMVAAAILVVVCAGIYMNWLYTEDQATMDLVQTLDAEKVMSDDTLILDQDAEVLSAGEEPVNTAQDYFEIGRAHV